MAVSIIMKSPLEKENRMIKVKHTTIAGPRSPSTRYINIAIIMAIKANEKKNHLLCQLLYSVIKRSFEAKKPARNKMMAYFTISLGCTPNRFTFTPLPSGPVPNTMVKASRHNAAKDHCQPLALLKVFFTINIRYHPESTLNFLRFTASIKQIPVIPKPKKTRLSLARKRSLKGSCKLSKVRKESPVISITTGRIS
ncbi:hypothetical protein D3C87_1501200 [compost metagenome]